MITDLHAALVDAADDSHIPFRTTPEATLLMARGGRRRRRLTLVAGLALVGTAAAVAASTPARFETRLAVDPEATLGAPGAPAPSPVLDRGRPGTITAPIATDDPAILDQCGTVAGYDFAGWTVVTSMAAAQGLEAVLTSAAGFTAYCSLEPKDWDSGSDQEVRIPERKDGKIGIETPNEPYELGFFSGSSLSIKTARTPIEGQLWNGSGTLYDERGEVAETASRIVLTFDHAGERFVIPVVQGRWAARIHLEAPGPLGGLHAAVQGQGGEILRELRIE